MRLVCAGMATLAASNVVMRLKGMPARNQPDVLPYVEKELDKIPKACPSIVNADDLGMAMGSEQ